MERARKNKKQHQRENISKKKKTMAEGEEEGKVK